MEWECADCGEKEPKDSKLLVCHHCGKPLCPRHHQIISDDAFSDGTGRPAARLAVHCSDCKKDYHPRATSLEPGMAGAPVSMP